MRNNRNKAKIMGGCFTFLLFCGIFIYAVNPIQLAMSLAGFDRRSETDAFLAQSAAAQLDGPIDWSGLSSTNLVQPGQLQGGETTGNSASVNGATVQSSAAEVIPETISSLPSITVNVQGQQGMIATDSLHAERVEQAQTTVGGTAVYAEYDQAGVNTLATELFGQYAPSNIREQVRNLRVDLKQGSVILYAEANLQVGWQELGIVMNLTNDGKQFEVAGVDINGQLYDTPPSGYIGDLIQTIELEGNHALTNIRIVTTSGNLQVQRIYVTEDMLQIIAN